MTVPGLTVALDNGTGSFPIDISQFVLASDGYDITRGRDDWQGAVTAGELTLTLNNSDGRFTPGSTILGSPSPIKVDQRIRVTVSGAGFDALPFDSTGFDAGTLTRFTGYVKSWPVSWPAVVSTFATVTLTATDAQARAERRTLRSMLEEEILLRGPSAYYTLGEPTGSASAVDTSGRQALPLTITAAPTGTGTPPTFGVGVGPVDGITAAQFFGGPYLAAGPQYSTVTAPNVQTLLVWFTTTASAVVGGIFSRLGYSLYVDGAGLLALNAPGFSYTSASTVNDGKGHVAAVTSDGTTVTLYLDGVVVMTHAVVGGGAFDGTWVGSAFGGLYFTGTIAHAAAYDAGLSQADITAISRAALTRLAGESSTARLTRLASYVGISAGSLDASLTAIPAQATSDSSAWDAIQEVADAEMGLVYIDGSGSLAFHNRARMAGKTAPDLILDAQYVTPDVQPVTDDQRIVNYFETTAEATGATQIVLNQASQTTHGRYPTSQTYLVQTDQEALDRANWIVSKQAEPGARYGSLTINLYRMTADQAALAVDALDLDCWLRVTSLASQNPGGTVVDVMVQGWRETATGESWAIACNVVPRSLYTAFIVDDPVFGAVDSYPLMF